MLKAPTAAITSGLLIATALLISAGAALSVDALPNRTVWQEKFRRPAEIPFPESNPYSEAKSKLGRLLFFDPLLSVQDRPGL
jgi:cytochrome c peroxidase